MKNKTIIKWVGTLVLLLLMQTVTQAGLYYLPTSDLWQGAQNYSNSSNGIKAYVEYAVYDKTDGFPTTLPLPTGTTGNYLYAYKIWNTSSTSLSTIATFQLLSLNNQATSSNWIGSIADGENALVPDAQEHSGTTFTWQFAGGYFEYSEQSAFLVFTSNYAPTAGKIYMSSQLGDDVPTAPGSQSGTQTPEPATIALLSIGALAFRRKR
jgi:hypothetical protein